MALKQQFNEAIRNAKDAKRIQDWNSESFYRSLADRIAEEMKGAGK